MKYRIDQDEFVLISDSNQPTVTGLGLPEATLHFLLDSDFVKTIIEAGLANVPLADLIRENIEELFSRQMQDVVSAKERLYEKAALILGELDDLSEGESITKMNIDMARELAKHLAGEIKSVHP